tara:strand:- start:1705 stop:2154 length:450 start_codon:yes stop_codon:yes gene_type:complete
LNFLFTLNRKYILVVTLFTSVILLIFLFLKYYGTIDTEIQNISKIVSNVDITEPRFSINSINQKIFVTAKEGNFVDKNIIMLKKNVLFKSEKFSIRTDSVIFNRKNQTASSKTKSLFISDNTKISSEGFDIYDNGKKIRFLGNSVILIK